MSYVLRYRSTRQDVWSWYWRRWRSGAWLRQLLLSIAISTYTALTNHLGVLAFCALLAVAFLVVIAAFAAWPQIAFKSQERTLEINAKGWSTRIGDKSGSKNWGEVESVRTEHGIIVITSRSGNALLVPTSAFKDPNEQHRFVVDAQAWHHGHAV